MNLLVIQEIIDPTFILDIFLIDNRFLIDYFGIFVCGPLQSFVVNVCSHFCLPQDVLSYRAVGISVSRIFTINHRVRSGT